METNNNNSKPDNSANTGNNPAIRIFRRIWRIIRIPLVIIIVLFISLMIYRFPVVKERLKTQEVVKKIQAQKLTLADVLGQRLPPEPDSVLKDATVEGIDANSNGIRDDVELAIFKLYPDSACIRAAELQYAMALQTELTQVFNSGTLVAAMKQEDRGFGCIFETEPGRYADLSNELFNQNKRINDRLDEVRNLTLNIDERKSLYENNFNKYKTSYLLPSGEDCDIDLTSLAN